MTRRHVALVGMMGAGKTTVGRELAGRLGRPFVDLDDVVAAGAGCSVSEVFAREGEAGFRARERAALAEVCAAAVPQVIACGGGAVLDPANRALLASCARVVWLRARSDALAARVADGADRPLLAGTSGAAARARRLADLAAEREAAYAAVADDVVDTDGRSADEVAGDLARRVAGGEPAAGGGAGPGPAR